MKSGSVINYDKYAYQNALNPDGKLFSHKIYWECFVPISYLIKINEVFVLEKYANILRILKYYCKYFCNLMNAAHGTQTGMLFTGINAMLSCLEVVRFDLVTCFRMILSLQSLWIYYNNIIIILEHIRTILDSEHLDTFTVEPVASNKCTVKRTSYKTSKTLLYCV